jgi:hypothetical protein
LQAGLAIAGDAPIAPQRYEHNGARRRMATLDGTATVPAFRLDMR